MSYQIIIRDVEIPNPNPIGLDEPFDYKDVEIDVVDYEDDFEVTIVEEEKYLPHEIEAIWKYINLKSTEKFIRSEIKRIDEENELESKLNQL